MGILDQITGMLKGGTSSTGGMSSLKGVMELVEQNGGIDGIMSKFQNGGLGDIMKSWISTGKNLPISASQLQSVFGSDTISKLASATGQKPEELTSKLTTMLPNLIDRLTPDGTVPSGGFSMKNIMDVAMKTLSKQ